MRVLSNALARTLMVSTALAFIISGCSDDEPAATDAQGPSTTTRVAPPSSETTTAAPGSTSTSAVPERESAQGTDPAPEIEAAGANPEPGSVLTGEGSFLTPPAEPTIRDVDAADGCDELVDEGWQGQCLIATSQLGTAAVVNQMRPAASSGRQEKRVLIYAPTGQGSQWALRLRAADNDGTTWDPSIYVDVVDIAGDGNPKIVISIVDGSRRLFDIVETTAEPVVHLTLFQGEARISEGGGFETWGATENPEVFVHQAVAYREGAWRVVSSEEVSFEDVPNTDTV